MNYEPEQEPVDVFIDRAGVLGHTDQDLEDAYRRGFDEGRTVGYYEGLADREAGTWQ